MKVLELDLSNHSYWLLKIKESDWIAGQYLYELIMNNKLTTMCGKSTRVLLLTRGLELISFCTLAEVDEIDTPLSPWIGFVYTFPKYRGNRYMGVLIDYAEKIAISRGYKSIYISTEDTGIYEKYGFSFLKNMKTNRGEDSRVYVRELKNAKQ